ncbi:diacylglycerol kinase [Leucobacter luti]|nr:diacylglycerol kinase [Leucobacter luti]
MAAIVWNPSKTEREALEAAVPQEFADALTWHETSPDDPGRAATRAALDAGATLVLAAGGDGTVRAVAEELAVAGASGSAVAELGVIPLGTGNLLARNLGVPLTSLRAACERAFTGAAEPLDIGWVETVAADGGTERHAFTVMAGFGIDAHMITETNEDLKSRAGWLAYVESLGRALSASEVIELRVGRDGGAAEPERAHTLIVGNCGMLQGGITLLPDADPADGSLDLLVLRADGIVGWADTLRNMVWDNGLKRALTGGEAAASSATTSHGRFASLEVELDEPRAFEIDGDELGEVTRISVSVQPGAIRVR